MQHTNQQSEMGARCEAAIESKMVEERYKLLNVKGSIGSAIFMGAGSIVSFSTNNVRAHNFAPDEARRFARLSA